MLTVVKKIPVIGRDHESTTEHNLGVSLMSLQFSRAVISLYVVWITEAYSNNTNNKKAMLSQGNRAMPL